MNLFGNKKGMFLKIINIILLLWFVGALIFCYSSLVNLIFPTPLQTYQDYKNYSCRIYETKENEEPKYYEDCKERYDAYKVSERNRNLKSLLIAFGNVVIVGTTIWFINSKKED